jgi:hypothetical protein
MAQKRTARKAAALMRKETIREAKETDLDAEDLKYSPPVKTVKKVIQPPRKPPKIETKKKEVRYMSVAQWHAVPANPRQPRDQVVRAPKAKHLHKFVPNLHEDVFMAEDTQGNKWKLTAHTRSEVWRQGLSDVIPERVCVTVVPVHNAEEAGKLCLFYDSRDAVNTSADLIHGALLYHGVPMNSPLLQKSLGLPTPLSYAYEIMLACYRQNTTSEMQELLTTFAPVSRANAIDYVGAFKEELAALDALNPGAKRGMTMLFRSPLLTAYLLASKKYGAENVLSFFEKMQDGNCGMQKGRKRDPIGYTEWLLHERVGQARAEHFGCVVKILAAIEVYMQGNYNARDENGKSSYYPPVSITNVVGVDLDVYLTEDNVRRTGRQNERNSVLKRK